MRKNIPNINYLILLIIKYLRVIRVHVKMVVNVQMLEIPLSVNVLLVTAENDVRIKVYEKNEFSSKHAILLKHILVVQKCFKHYFLLIIKYLRVILARVKMEVNVQILEILPLSVNVLLVTVENNVRTTVSEDIEFSSKRAILLKHAIQISLLAEQKYVKDYLLLIIKYLNVILAHVKMEVNVQMLEIHSSVNVLLVTAVNDVRRKV